LDAAKLGRAVEIAHTVEENCNHGKISIGAAGKDVQQRFFPTGGLGVRWSVPTVCGEKSPPTANERGASRVNGVCKYLDLNNGHDVKPSQESEEVSNLDQ
jgi:hypothetical protein